MAVSLCVRQFILMKRTGFQSLVPETLNCAGFRWRDASNGCRECVPKVAVFKAVSTHSRRKTEESKEHLEMALDGKYVGKNALWLRAIMINKSQQNTATEVLGEGSGRI